MSPAWVRKRAVATSTKHPRGTSYQVLYRRGGRGWPIEAAGSFPTEREAKLRRDLVAGWLAAGLNPKDEFAKLAAAPPKVRTLTEWAAAFTASRIDIGGSSTVHDRSAIHHLTSALGDRLPDTIQVADLQALVNQLADRLAPSTIKTYLTKWKMLLDYTAVDPNPATSKHLRLPRVEREEVSPPTATHLLGVLAVIPAKYRLPLVVLEQTGMRVGEAESLTWGDVDEAGLQFRLKREDTKTSRPRWVKLPEWLMGILTDTVPVDDRTASRRVFHGFTGAGARAALRKWCTVAGVPVFTPHDLRHRRATIWHHEGLPVRVLMERGGWATSEIPIEVYSHLMPLDEADQSVLAALLVVTT